METIKVKSNKSKRTFTIRTYEGDELISKYRTLDFPKDVFQDMEFYTENDWKNFLRTQNGSYFNV